MAEELPMTVAEAAEALDLDPRTVRWLVASGDLPAVKRGRTWWIDRGSVYQRRRQPRVRGRRLSPRAAWAVLLHAAGVHDISALAAHAHSPSRTRNWLARHPLPGSAVRLRGRARSERFDAHPSELKRVLADDDVMLTGISASQFAGVHGGADAVEGYAPVAARDRLVADHGLVPGGGPVLLRWVDDDLWPHVREPVAPRVVVLVDLLEHDDPRARREAERLLSGP
jgi:excisionase family DNA binding protein